MGWLRETFLPYIRARREEEGNFQFLLICDSIYHQRMREFVQCVHENGGEILYGPAGKTEGWQPIDHGHVGALIKQLVRNSFEAWCTCPSKNDETRVNYEDWYENKLNASQKRVMASLLYGEARELVEN